MNLTAGETQLLAGLLGQLRARARYVGLVLPPGVDDLHLRLVMSASGHETSGTATESDMIDVNEVARILGYSPRHVRRIAEQLGGQRTGRQWMFDRRTIELIGEEHRGTTTTTATAV